MELSDLVGAPAEDVGGLQDQAWGRGPAPFIPAADCSLAGMQGILTNRAGDFGLSGREAWVFISIKNRRFTRAYIDWFVDMCEAEGLVGHICPVDEPYRFNRSAELACDHLPVEESAKIDRLSADIARMVQKALNGKLTKRVDIVSWRRLEEATPVALKDELRRAFERGTSVRGALRDHVSSVKPVDTEKSFERYAEFFLCEVPVLMHAYYGTGGIMDIYPGPQVDFFWQIEAGVFSEELPLMTSLAGSNRPVLYLETLDRAFGGL